MAAAVTLFKLFHLYSPVSGSGEAKPVSLAVELRNSADTTSQTAIVEATEDRTASRADLHAPLAFGRGMRLSTSGLGLAATPASSSFTDQITFG
eukprot:COSAG05_NODE_1612_length_4407_cov_43.627205_4_plen_94_part_00